MGECETVRFRWEGIRPDETANFRAGFRSELYNVYWEWIALDLDKTNVPKVAMRHKDGRFVSYNANRP